MSASKLKCDFAAFPVSAMVKHIFRFTTCALFARARASTIGAQSRPLRGGGARLLMAAAALKPPPCRITFVTDVEGALDYWERFAELSEVLERDASGAQ